jgi:hypothetical protein
MLLKEEKIDVFLGANETNKMGIFWAFKQVARLVGFMP